MIETDSSKSISRRKFIKLSGLSGAVLALGFSLPVLGTEAEETSVLHNLSSGAVAAELGPFILIDSTGKVTLMAHRPEMGQGTFQALPLIIAEELEVPFDKVTIQIAPIDSKFGNQSAGGSNSVKGSWNTLRKAGAAAREMLVKAASQKWQANVDDCFAKNGNVINRTTKASLSYGELVEMASKLDVPQEPKLKDPKDFKLIGKSLPRPDILNKVNGTAQFGIDMALPGMLYASIERSSVFHGKVTKFDDTAAKAIKGVKYVLLSERKINKHTLQGVAVVADSYYAATQGRKALKIEWHNGVHEQFSSKGLSQQYRELAKTDGLTDKNEGDFEKAFAGATNKVEATYELPFAAHATMEPQNALAYVKGDTCEIWASTQVPANAKSSVAKYLGIPEQNVTVHLTFNGGGFGRRLYPDPIMEAVYLSKQTGAPIKLIWTREDDMSQGPFRPGTYSDLKGALDATGNLVALQHKVVAPSLGFDSNPQYDRTKVDRGVLEGISESAYEVPNFRTQFVLAETDVPIAAWRSVYSSTTAFAHECFIDELAVAAKKDPLAFRLGMAHKSERVKQVLTALAEKSAWNKPLPKGWGKGVAVWEFFAGLCGHVVFVSKKAGKPIKIEKVVAVIDSGITINPDNVKAQTEGNIIMALTAALKDEILFENGKAVKQNFHDYRMLRINETPIIEVHMLTNLDKPRGVGEPGFPPLAPALANAIFSATGKRIRKLPFDLETV